MTHPSPDSPEALWQSQKKEHQDMTLADIRRKAQAFQTRIRRRNAREYLFAVAGTLLYVVFIWLLPGMLTKIGSAVTLLSIYSVVYQLRRDGAAREVPVDAAAADCLAFHRRELARQRDLLRRVGPWHIGPMVPGLALFFGGLWLANVDDLGDAVVMTISGLLMAAVLLLVYRLNVRAANELQRQLDLLAE
jgi:hypothetical protein